MSKIRGKDFAKTVIITPEESDVILQKAAIDRRAAADRRAATDRRVAAKIKGPRKGLSGWGIFFLILTSVVAYYGIVALLMHFNVLPSG